VPPKYADARIVDAISAPDGNDVLRVLATETASIITLARMLHDGSKAERKALKAAKVDAETGEILDDVSFFGAEASDLGDLLK
jgi:hypothetical protein